MGIKIATYRCDWCGKKERGPDKPGGWHIIPHRSNRHWRGVPLLCLCFCSDQCRENWRQAAISRALSRYSNRQRE